MAMSDGERGALERWLHVCAWLVLGLILACTAHAHSISGKDAAYVTNTAGAHVFPYLYLGAKHMVTGYDHLLFLFAVVFFCTASEMW